MNVETTILDNLMTIAVSGKLDITTAPALQEAVDSIPPEITELVIDLDGLEYTSSVGLRCLLAAQKIMDEQGSMKVIHVCDDIMDIFRLTCFDDMITIE